MGYNLTARMDRKPRSRRYAAEQSVTKGKYVPHLKRQNSICLLAVLLLFTVSACKPSPPPMDAETKTKVVAKLVKADAVDGQVDKIIAKCAGCSLAMDGSDKHTMPLAGYTLHLCSDLCKTSFGKDPAKKLLAIEITK
ncbi:hypothetical protein JYU10_00080 [bacterium AH-315-J04]|nr:hypothetical protein [bacterium AH-315-J04]